MSKKRSKAIRITGDSSLKGMQQHQKTTLNKIALSHSSKKRYITDNCFYKTNIIPEIVIFSC